MSADNTPSRKLSRTTIRGEPPSRRKAFSCNSAHTRALDRPFIHLLQLARLQVETPEDAKLRRHVAGERLEHGDHVPLVPRQGEGDFIFNYARKARHADVHALRQ